MLIPENFRDVFCCHDGFVAVVILVNLISHSLRI